MAPLRTLTQRELNRAVLARQGLLSGHDAPLPRVLERVCGIQAQYAPSMYVGLWSRMASFERSSLTSALAERRVIQATLMRITIHLVSPRDYWPFVLATRAARQALWLRARRGSPSEAEMLAGAERLRPRIAEGPIDRKELDELVGKDVASGIGNWVDLVRVPPAGTWERRRADVFGDAVAWVGKPPELSAQEAACVLIRRYLAAFGPASRTDIVSFTGLPGSLVDAALGELQLRRFAGDLVDVARAPLPPPATEAPVRFLPTWDAVLLVHCRRAGILAEEHRPLIFSTKLPASVGTFLVDGTVAGTWRLEGGHVAATPFGPLTPAARRDVEQEAERLTEFHA